MYWTDYREILHFTRNLHFSPESYRTVHFVKKNNRWFYGFRFGKDARLKLNEHPFATQRECKFAAKAEILKEREQKGNKEASNGSKKS